MRATYRSPVDTSPGREQPSGSTYDWVRRAQSLLDGGDAAPALVLLERARRAEPSSASVLEALARAQFETGRRSEAAATFAELTAIAPDDDYAHFGLGLCLVRLGEHAAAAEHLALAAAMRPERREYVDQLTQVRATLRARERRR